MAKFYFTYGSEDHDFKGGWTVVEAENIYEAFDILWPSISAMKTETFRLPGCTMKKNSLRQKCQKMEILALMLTSPLW